MVEYGDWNTVTALHSSCACCAVSPPLAAWGRVCGVPKGRPSRRSSIAIHSGLPSGRPMAGTSSIRVVAAASAGIARRAAKSEISARNGATVVNSSSSPASCARVLDHGQRGTAHQATIGLSATPPPTDAACPSPLRQSDPGTDGPSIGTDADRRGIVPARLGKDRPRPIRVRRRTPSGRDWASDNRPRLICRRGGQPAIGAIVVGLEKHKLAPITALGDMVGQARHNNARDPGHACA
jgi:hypothetical protein